MLRSNKIISDILRASAGLDTQVKAGGATLKNIPLVLPINSLQEEIVVLPIRDDGFYHPVIRRDNITLKAYSAINVSDELCNPFAIKRFGQNIIVYLVTDSSMTQDRVLKLFNESMNKTDRELLFSGKIPNMVLYRFI